MCGAVVLHTAGFRRHKTPDPDTYVRVRIPALKSYLKRIEDLIQNLNSPVQVILIHLLSKFKPMGLIQLSKLIGDIRLTKSSKTENTAPRLARDRPT